MTKRRSTKKTQKTSTTSIVKPKPKRVSKAKAKKGELTRGQAYNLLKAIGKGFATDTSLVLDLTGITFPSELRANFLTRSVDEKSGKMVKNSLFGSRYRSTWDAQDELFSTASTRYFVDGLLNKVPRNKIPEKVWDNWTALVDMISSLRIPTRYSGFSLSGTNIMQHPTAVGEGFFSPLGVTESHGTYDSERVKYIGRAVQKGQLAGQGMVELLRTAMRAAIEFSLNYFTAPVTASNVKPFSTKSKKKSGSKELQDQLASRERIKEIYTQLGGSLRDLPQTNNQPTVETPEESWDRPWQQTLAITTTDPFPVAPPSPRRSRKNANATTTPLQVPVPVNGNGLQQGSSQTTTTTTSLGQLSPQGSSSSTSVFSAPVQTLSNTQPFSFSLPLSSLTPFSTPSPFAQSPFQTSGMLSGGSVALMSQAVSLVDDVMQGMGKAVQSVFSTPQTLSSPFQGFPQLQSYEPSAPYLEDLPDYLPVEGRWDYDPFAPSAPDLEEPLDYRIDDFQELLNTDFETDFAWQFEPSAPLLDDLPDYYSTQESWQLETPYSQSPWSVEPSAPSFDDLFDGEGIEPFNFGSVNSGFESSTGESGMDLEEMFPSVPTTMPGMLQPYTGGELTDDMFPTIPNGMPGQLQPYTGGELTDDMFPTVPNGAPSGGMSMEDAGVEAGGAEDLLLLLA